MPPSLFTKLRKPLDSLKHAILYRHAKKPRAAAAEKTPVVMGRRVERRDLSETTLAELAASFSELVSEVLTAQMGNVNVDDDGREEGVESGEGEGVC